MNKKGLSDVISTVLIILIALAAVVLIWVFVRPLIFSTGSEIGSGVVTSSFEIPANSVSINPSSSFVQFVIKRNSGQGEMAGVVVVLEDKNGRSESYKFNVSINELEARKVNVTYSNLNNLNKISIALVTINENGKEKTGQMIASYKVTGNEPVAPSPVSNYALTLNGIDQYIEVIDYALLNPSNEITLESWINPSSSGNREIISKWSSSNDTRKQYRLWIHNNNYTFSLRSGTNDINLDCLVEAEINKWKHVIVIANGSKLSCYINGTKTAEIAYNGVINVPTNPNKLGIGIVMEDNGNPASSGYFHGSLDELRIYNKSLTALEISEHYNNGNGQYGNDELGLVLGFHFDDLDSNSGNSGITGNAVNSGQIIIKNYAKNGASGNVANGNAPNGLSSSPGILSASDPPAQFTFIVVGPGSVQTEVFNTDTNNLISDCTAQEGNTCSFVVSPTDLRGVDYEATPDSGARFISWDGDCPPTPTSGTFGGIQPGDIVSCRAIFTDKKILNLNLVDTTNHELFGGRVESSEGQRLLPYLNSIGFVCYGNAGSSTGYCMAAYDSIATPYTLTAINYNSYAHYQKATSWSGDCVQSSVQSAGSLKATVLMNSDKTCTANFESYAPFKIKIIGIGKVLSPGGKINIAEPIPTPSDECVSSTATGTVTCNPYFKFSSSFSLTAVPDPHWGFEGWSCNPSTARSIGYFVDGTQPSECTATFKPISALTFTGGGAGGLVRSSSGNIFTGFTGVYPSPSKRIECGKEGTVTFGDCGPAVYLKDTSVHVDLKAATGNIITSVTGAGCLLDTSLTSTTTIASVSVNMNGDKSCNVVFSPPATCPSNWRELYPTLTVSMSGSLQGCTGADSHPIGNPWNNILNASGSYTDRCVWSAPGDVSVISNDGKIKSLGATLWLNGNTWVFDLANYYNQPNGCNSGMKLFRANKVGGTPITQNGEVYVKDDKMSDCSNSCGVDPGSHNTPSSVTISTP